MTRIGPLVLTGLLLAGAPAAAALRPELIALRGGDNAGYIPEGFHYQALALRWRLPRQARWGDWEAATHLEAGAGRVAADGTYAGLYTLGPSVSVRRGRLLLELGTAPGYLSKNGMNGRAFGGGFQFTSHVGAYLMLRGWSLGYRLQHTSNGGLYSDNDGLDLQMVDLWLLF